MISSYVRKSHHRLRRWAMDPRVQQCGRGAAHCLAGFCLSAAGLEQGMLPLVMGLVWACRGWRAVLVAAGGALGYGIFWSGGQGILWTGLSLAGVLLLGDRRISREQPLLIPALGMLTVSGVGLGYQLLAGDTTSVALYLIRVALGGAAPWLFSRWLEKREPVLEWLCQGLFALSLAQIAPVRWLGLGFVAAGTAAVRGTLPGAALVGLGVDLAGITPVPITAVTVLSYLVRLLPRYPRWASRLMPGCAGILFMYLLGRWDLQILPGLFLGGIAAGFFADAERVVPRRGETGAAQVRLEMAAQVLKQTGQLLEEAPERFVDTGALVQRAVSEACTGCAAREHCRDARKMTQLPGEILEKPLLAAEEIPVRCKKSGRVLAELRRARDQLRSIRADRQRQREYRDAVAQQYDFLSGFLRELSDGLIRKGQPGQPSYDPVVSVYGNRGVGKNGDRTTAFAGVQNRYYIILCDGMGTGPGAVQEGKTALGLLERLLRCGFPAGAALESLNSLCALRDRAGAVTVDLAEVCLDTGKTTLYKWGAAASYLLAGGGLEKLGGATAPPGLTLSGCREVSCSLQLRKGQTLLLVSDGVEVLPELFRERQSPAALAEALLQQSRQEDDATLVAIQLLPVRP